MTTATAAQAEGRDGTLLVIVRGEGCAVEDSYGRRWGPCRRLGRWRRPVRRQWHRTRTAVRRASGVGELPSLGVLAGRGPCCGLPFAGGFGMGGGQLVVTALVGRGDENQAAVGGVPRGRDFVRAWCWDEDLAAVADDHHGRPRPLERPSWRPTHAWPRAGGRHPYRSSTGDESEFRQSRPLAIHAVQLGSLQGQLKRSLSLAASEWPGWIRGRIRVFSSDCLRSPLQPVLAGHSLIAPTQAHVRKLR